MSLQHDGLSEFRAAYLDYLEGTGGQAPSLDDLNDTERKTAEAFIESTKEAAGIDPYASRPSIEQLLDGVYDKSFPAIGEHQSAPAEPAAQIADLHAKRLQESFPLKEAIERGWIPDADAETTTVAIREFFESTSESAPPIAYAARRLSQADDSEPKQQAWLARVRHIASCQEVEDFDIDKLADIARRLPRELRHGPRSIPQAVQLLATCGRASRLLQRTPQHETRRSHDVFARWLSCHRPDYMQRPLRQCRLHSAARMCALDQGSHHRRIGIDFG